jgi:hypothetical protein
MLVALFLAAAVLGAFGYVAALIVYQVARACGLG